MIRKFLIFFGLVFSAFVVWLAYVHLRGYLAPSKQVGGQVIASGSFREDDPGQDRGHWGRGSFSLVNSSGVLVLQIEEDFLVFPGPDYHVFASNEVGIVDEQSFAAAETYDLGPLVKMNGASVYPIQPGFVPASITIWCLSFSEFIASGDFTIE